MVATINEINNNFTAAMDKCSEILSKQNKVNIFNNENYLAVGISGGPDSFALLKLLSNWASNKQITIIAITIDHKLRAESKDEALYIKETISSWSNVEHVILEWNDEKPKTSIMEKARKARYNIINDYLVSKNCKYLFIGHHMDDQAETVLFRLSKGSGIKGLGGINIINKFKDISIIRPLLDFEKDELIKFCKASKIKYIDDPTNKNENYSRPRLRSGKEILEKEGLTNQRLAKLAKRIKQANQALDYYADIFFSTANINENIISFNLANIIEQPIETRNRVIIKAINIIGNNSSDYGVRLHRAENAIKEIFESQKSTSRTIGGCLITKSRKNNLLTIQKENFLSV